MAKEKTPEQRAAMLENLRKAREARTAKAAQERELPTLEEVEEIVAEFRAEQQPFDGQCIYCSLEFKSPENLFRHQSAMHKGEAPTAEPTLPAGAEKLPAGSIVRTRNIDGTPGIPMKTHWPKAMLENGWECDDPRDRVDGQGGWRYIPTEDDSDPPLCHRCGGSMHKLSHMEWYEAPENAPPVVVFQGLTYHIARGEQNHIPDIIAGQIRQAMADTRAAELPLRTALADGSAGRLNMTGFIEPIEEEATA